jgi:hypothetical protein
LNNKKRTVKKFLENNTVKFHFRHYRHSLQVLKTKWLLKKVGDMSPTAVDAGRPLGEIARG